MCPVFVHRSTDLHRGHPALEACGLLTVWQDSSPSRGMESFSTFASPLAGQDPYLIFRVILSSFSSSAEAQGDRGCLAAETCFRAGASRSGAGGTGKLAASCFRLRASCQALAGQPFGGPACITGWIWHCRSAGSSSELWVLMVFHEPVFGISRAGSGTASCDQAAVLPLSD